MFVFLFVGKMFGILLVFRIMLMFFINDFFLIWLLLNRNIVCFLFILVLISICRKVESYLIVKKRGYLIDFFYEKWKIKRLLLKDDIVGLKRLYWFGSFRLKFFYSGKNCCKVNNVWVILKNYFCYFFDVFFLFIFGVVFSDFNLEKIIVCYECS